jgi:GNAT superfamily N-acetyltransferase
MTYRAPAPLARSHQLDGFSSGEPALDDWLVRHARAAQASDSARVFVVTAHHDDSVAAYYALAAAQVQPAAAVARALAGQPQSRPVPAILIARLAVDERHQGLGLGRSVLQDALLRCAEAADSIGARVVLVHAKSAAAKSWYMRYGFAVSPADPMTLQLLMKDLRRFLRTG